jgi:hypothetical protein
MGDSSDGQKLTTEDLVIIKNAAVNSADGSFTCETVARVIKTFFDSLQFFKIL